MVIFNLFFLIAVHSINPIHEWFFIVELFFFLMLCYVPTYSCICIYFYMTKSICLSQCNVLKGTGGNSICITPFLIDRRRTVYFKRQIL